MKVINRSDGSAVYHLPELNNVRRLFSVGETKEISEDELEALFQIAGGAEIIKDYLLVDSKEWVEAHWDAPVEYFWKEEEITNCLLYDDLELFKETIDYAPAGVLDIMKRIAWQLPLTDLNKVQVMRDHPKLGFDVLTAIEIMKKPDGSAVKKPVKKERLRRREAE